jgi:hypothetical protein
MNVFIGVRAPPDVSMIGDHGDIGMFFSGG